MDRVHVALIFRSDGQARLLSALLLTGDELSVTDLPSMRPRPASRASSMESER
ncbi:MAG: hypothetical protein JNL54_10230 [Kineosporiaceae bacterium]|nr:hypothetical protein [Kineosporiaceae bacterium]